MLKNFISPEKRIESESGLSLILKGVTMAQEQWCLNPKHEYENLPEDKKTPERKEMANILHFERMFRACVKRVEGVCFVQDGKEIDANDFLKSENGILTEESYTFLMRILNEDPTVIPKIYSFYTESINLSKFISVKKK